jgi:FSR family fosmidomycin resistance protein-like MFS transporter
MESKPKVDYRGLVLLCMGHMVADLNTNALPALLPFIKDALGLSYAMAGMIVLFSNIASSVIQPLFGYLADRRSLHWFLPTGCFLAGLGIALLGWAPNYGTILFLGVVSGLGVAIYHPEGWRTANFFAGEKKATGMSIFAVGGNLGFAFGPPLGIFFVKHFGLKGSAIFIVPAVLMAAVFLFSRFWRIRRASISPPAGSSVPFWAAIRPAIYPMSLLLGMILFRSWTHIGLITFIPFYFINYMKGDPMQAGTLLFAFLGAGTVGTVAGGPFADRFGHKKIILFSLGCTGPLLVLFLLSSGMWSFIWFTLAGFILIFSFSISMAMGQSFFPKNVGMASGLILGLAFGMGGLGAALLGLFADYWGVPATLWVITFLPWIGFIFTALIPHSQKKES